MTDRESRDRLVKLIKDSSQYINELDDLVERVADHLIENGATIPVRCGECKYYEEVEYYHPTDKETFKNVCRLYHRQMHQDDYCSYGQRKENGDE